MPKGKKPEKNDNFQVHAAGLNVLSEVIITVGKIGEENTIKALSEARGKAEPYAQKSSHKEVYDFINKKIYTETKVSVEALTNGIYIKKDETAYFALSYACYAYKKYCGWDQSRIISHFSKCRNSVYKYEKFIKELHPRVNKFLYEMKSKLDIAIDEFYRKSKEI